jgi:hypothetical protein
MPDDIRAELSLIRRLTPEKAKLRFRVLAYRLGKNPAQLRRELDRGEFPHPKPRRSAWDGGKW